MVVILSNRLGKAEFDKLVNELRKLHRDTQRRHRDSQREIRRLGLMREGGELFFQVAAFGFLFGEGEGLLVGGAGFGRFSQPAA